MSPFLLFFKKSLSTGFQFKTAKQVIQEKKITFLSTSDAFQTQGILSQGMDFRMRNNLLTKQRSAEIDCQENAGICQVAFKGNLSGKTVDP